MHDDLTSRGGYACYFNVKRRRCVEVMRDDLTSRGGDA